MKFRLMKIWCRGTSEIFNCRYYSSKLCDLNEKLVYRFNI